jgi:hypothetical protein
MTRRCPTKKNLAIFEDGQVTTKVANLSPLKREDGHYYFSFTPIWRISEKE